MSTVRETLDALYARHDGDVDYDVMIAALEAREDGVADYIRLAGAQFGLLPGIVSKVLMDAGLGTPPSDDERAMITANFVASMAELRRMIEEQNRGEE